MRLAHFSDVHVTHLPLTAGFTVKRVAAWAAHVVTGRERHFAGSDHRIAQLLSDVDAQAVDHALCTGDVTSVSSVSEFARAAELFGPRLAAPDRFTVLPGNHDRYTPGATRQRLFERHFGALSNDGVFPLVKALAGNVTLVALDSARPTSLLDSSGLLGERQRSQLLDVLTDPLLRARFVVVALHYGLLRSRGQRDARPHRLVDDLELLALLDREDVSVDLVVHGHMHTAYAVRSQRRLLLNAGSATDLHTTCGYSLYDIDAQQHRLRCERRVWNSATDRYEAAAASPLNFEASTR
jgi:3',5'-cyclic AMP phosphodiesterase CpdA